MSTEQTKPTKRCRLETGFGVRVAVGLAIILVSAAVCGAIGAVIGAAINDMAACAWGVAAGAGLGSVIMMATVFRERS